MKDNFDLKLLLDLDKAYHEPARLAIVLQLSVVERADFIFLMNTLGLSQGNLSSHLRKLEELKIVEIIKEFKGKKPLTTIVLTEVGRAGLDQYLATWKQLLD